LARTIYIFLAGKPPSIRSYTAYIGIRFWPTLIIHRNSACSNRSRTRSSLLPPHLSRWYVECFRCSAMHITKKQCMLKQVTNTLQIVAAKPERMVCANDVLDGVPCIIHRYIKSACLSRLSSVIALGSPTSYKMILPTRLRTTHSTTFYSPTIRRVPNHACACLCSRSGTLSPFHPFI